MGKPHRPFRSACLQGNGLRTADGQGKGGDGRKTVGSKGVAMRCLPWGNLTLGFWLTGAPLLLGFREHGVPALNDVIVGLVLLGTAAVTLYLDRPEQE